jgi:hypothetical protein
MLSRQDKSIPRVLFAYFVGINLFQILQLSLRYPAYDTIWKGILIIGIVLYAVHAARYVINLNKWYLLGFAAILITQIVSPVFTSDFSSLTSGITTYFMPSITYLVFMILLGRSKINKKQLLYFAKLIVYFAVYACLFNIAVNYSSILSISSSTKSYELSFSSFFNNRNTFALYLFLGAACNSFVLQSKERKHIYKITLVIILASLALTLSRSAITALLIFLGVYLVLNKRSSYIVKASFLVILASLWGSRIQYIKEFIVLNLVRAGAGLSGRERVYQFAINNFERSSLLFGYGYNDAALKLKQSVGLTSYHNSYIAAFMYGGLSLFTLFISILVFSYMKILSIKKHDTQSSVFFMSLLIAYLVYSLTESQLLFHSSATNFILSTFIVFLPLYMSNEYNTRQENK